MAQTVPEQNDTAIIDIALTALAFGSGVTDVATFLTLGNVFTSAMTGNMALLGIALSHADVLAASHSISALAGFTLGACLATVLLVIRKDQAGSLRDLRPLLLVEIVYLILFAALLTMVRPPGENTFLYVLILLSAIGVGIQGAVARRINSPGINTVVFTSTLISIVAALTTAFLRRSSGDRVSYATKRQIGIFFAYVLGAVAAGLLIDLALPAVAWLPAIAALIALACCEAAIRTGAVHP